MPTRSWREFRIGTFIAIMVVHVMAVFGAVRLVQDGIPTSAVQWALGLYIVSSLGITVGYHRLWTHQSFRTPALVQFLLAFAGALACEGPILKWYKDHTQHHAYTDIPGDPHTPTEGFWWAHIVWLFWPVPVLAGYRQTMRADDDRIVRWQARWYLPLAAVGFVVPFLAAGWQALWLAGFIRVVVHWHVTWAVNSVCHRWGKKARGRDGRILPSRNQSTNNVLIALLGTGEGWHATHHADPNSYELGIHPWQWDPGKWTINVLAFCGLASDRRRFSY